MEMKLVRLSLMLVFVCLACAQAQAALSYATASESGIWLSRAAEQGCDAACQNRLTTSLRRLTGLLQLQFSARGELTPGDQRTARGGASAARGILSAAFASGHRFVIEDHSASPTVNFGQLDEGLKYEDARNGRRLTIWRVRLDFADFDKMQAPPEVRATFDPGFTLLHELLHGLGFKDAAHKDELGEVERQVNRARAELGLLLRAEYFGSALKQTPHFVLVRLRFQPHAQPRPRQSYLYFVVLNSTPRLLAGDCVQLK